MVQPLISTLCHSASQSNHNDHIDRSLELYNDLACAVPPSSQNTVPGDSGFNCDCSAGPDAYMYSMLLHVMGIAVDVQKYSEITLCF